MKKLISVLLVLVSLAVGIMGCTATDPLVDDLYTRGDIYIWDGGAWVAVVAGGAGGGSGNVTGPAVSTDHAVVRWDGVTGKLIEDSLGTVLDDFANLTLGGDLDTGGDVNSGNDLNCTNDLDVTDNADVGGDLRIVGSIIRELGDGSGGYWHEYILPATAFSKGASGATQVSPDADTLGGWVLDRDDTLEIIFAISHIEDDWDGVSDPIAEVYFEVNVDNTLGNVADTVDLKMIYRYKGVGETADKIQTVEVATVVGQSAQYKLFDVDFPLDWNLAGNVLEASDIISLGISLETDTSEVDSVIINFAEFKYPTRKPASER